MKLLVNFFKISLVSLLLMAYSVEANTAIPFGDGTLPFNMAGNMIKVDETADVLGSRLKFDRPSGLSPSGSGQASSECPTNLRWYAVGGEVEIDYDGSFEILGVCAPGLSEGRRRVVATKGSNKLVLDGKLRVDAGRLQVFDGSASVEDARGRALKKFKFELVE